MLIHADVRAYTASYDGPMFHALLSDAPYHLTELKQVAQSFRSQSTNGGSEEQRAARAGFMGKAWDGGNIAFEAATWRALTAPLHPGGFGMVFASSRGWHRLACAIEDAGMIIHPTIFCWAYGSGFPKATRIDTQIDKAAGALREAGEPGPYAARRPRATRETNTPGAEYGFNAGNLVTAPATPLAALWASHRYGLQALKPALEPIIVFQRPYSGRPVENITRTGAGALNIDAGRVVASLPTRHNRAELGYGGGNLADEYTTGSAAGRWPANLVLLHLPACADECAPGCAVAALGAQSGTSTSPATVTRGGNRASAYGMGEQRDAPAPGDEGTAARYFFNADYMLDRLEACDAVRYVPKASTAEREAGLEAADDGRANIHATVKPISLARYLASLLLPPDAYAPRRLLVPFAGVGSEMIGAELAGWDEVVGVEREAEHIPIAHARLAWWRRAARRLRTTDPRVILANEEIAHKESLFDLEA